MNDTWARRRIRATGVLALLVCLLIAGCTSRAGVNGDPSSTYFPTAPPSGAQAAEPEYPARTAIANSGAVLSGPVSRPDQQHTPGVVANSDTNAVCTGPRHVHQHVVNATQATVYASYHLAFPQRNQAYALDYLIPLNLGGAPVLENLWPAATTGIGFHQKQQLNQHVRALVCRGQLTLAKAQHDIAADWYALWLAYSGG